MRIGNTPYNEFVFFKSGVKSNKFHFDICVFLFWFSLVSQVFEQNLYQLKLSLLFHFEN